MIFEKMTMFDYEEIIFAQNRDCGLCAIIAIHDTTLGPAVGGIRTNTYKSFEDALNDALRLSRGMTYKCAVSGLNAGGGKTVVLNHEGMKRGEAFCALGAFIESLNGRYCTAGDLGTTYDDLVQVHQTTKYVEPLELNTGNLPTPRAVVWGLKSAISEVLGCDKVKGIRFAIQGLGKVGHQVAESLWEEGASLIVTDTRPEILEEAEHDWGVEVVAPDEIFDQECEVFCPCAYGGIINPSTVYRLNCRIVAGSANNQLSEDKMSNVLAERGITYVPDFVISAGGLTQYVMLMNGDKSDQSPRIGQNVKAILRMAVERGITPLEAATWTAEERLKKSKNYKDLYYNIR